MHLVNSFNNGITNDFITPVDSALSGDPITIAGSGCQYAYKDGHYCVTCPSASDGLHWETGNHADWHPGYYIRFDLYIEAGQPTWGIQDIAMLFLYDGIDNSHGASWLHKMVAADDGYLWIEDVNAVQTMSLGAGAIRFGQWNTITLAQDISTGKARLTLRHKDGSTVTSGEITFPSRSVGLYSVDLGRLGSYGSGGTGVYIDNLRGYNTPYASEPAPRNPRDGSDPETPGPVTDPWKNDPDPNPVDPNDPTWSPAPIPVYPPGISGISPNHGPIAGGTVVTISGTNLDLITDVTFDSLPATALSPNVAGTLITVNSPAHAAGPVGVDATSAYGAASTGYTYDAAAVLPSPDPWHPSTPAGPPVPPPKGVTVAPAPGQFTGDNFVNGEILYSGAAFTQKGVVLGIQGVLQEGTVLAEDNVDHRWYAYSAAGTNGRNIARGILRHSVDASYVQFANIVLQGIVKLSVIPNLDANAITQLGAHIDAERNFLSF